MKSLRLFLVGGALLLASSGLALADDEWQTVSLDNNPKFTIDIPAKVGADYKPKQKNAAQGQLFSFAMPADSGGLVCVMSRFKAGKPEDEKKFRAMLASPRRNVLCDDDDATNLTLSGSNSLTVDGQPAGECVVNYSYDNSSLPGRVTNTTEISGAKHHYQLTCNYLDSSQAEATAAWVAQWSDKVKHIQQSIRLPASEKK
jgi:hypothetical protein